MSEDFTRDELRALHTWLNAYAVHAERQGKPVPALFALRDKAARVLAARAGAPQRGPLVFRIELPLELCPTLNAYAKHEPWAQVRIRRAIDWQLVAAIATQPRAQLGKAPRRRWIRFTRHSSRAVDEVTVDVLGGKVVIDRLVHAGVIAGDAAKHVVREAAWEPAKPGEGKGVVEVFEIV